jgi:hypothetical protein
MIPLYDILKLRKTIKTQEAQTMGGQRVTFFSSEPELQEESIAEASLFSPRFQIYPLVANGNLQKVVLDIHLDHLMYAIGYQKVRDALDTVDKRRYTSLVDTLTGESAEQSIAQFGTPDYWSATQDFNEMFSDVLLRGLSHPTSTRVSHKTLLAPTRGTMRDYREGKHVGTRRWNAYVIDPTYYKSYGARSPIETWNDFMVRTDKATRHFYEPIARGIKGGQWLHTGDPNQPLILEFLIVPTEDDIIIYTEKTRVLVRFLLRLGFVEIRSRL